MTRREFVAWVRGHPGRIVRAVAFVIAVTAVIAVAAGILIAGLR